MRSTSLALIGMVAIASGAGCQSGSQSAGHSRSQAQMEQPRSQVRSPQQTAQQEQTTIPIVKEEVQVGKREVQGGRARVETRVTEETVEKQVPLREEHVSVERRSVDRPAKPEEMQQSFNEKSIEMTETREEPVVAKRPRVTEEITLKKEADTRTETVRESVRSTDVDVQGQESKQARGSGLSGFESDFKEHYRRHFQNTGVSYEQYRPAYHYGYGLASQGGGDWTSVEPQAREQWERQHPGSWSQLRPAIRYGWERGRQSRG